MKLLIPRPRKRNVIQRPLATIVFNAEDRTLDRYMPLATAQRLHAEQKLSLLDVGNGFHADFGPRRSWRDLLHNVWPPHHPEVLEAIHLHSTKGSH